MIEAKKDDPFTSGQFVGMLVVLTYIEENNGIPKDFLEKLKRATAEKVALNLDKPTEDVHLLVETLVKNIGKI